LRGCACKDEVEPQQVHRLDVVPFKRRENRPVHCFKHGLVQLCNQVVVAVKPCAGCNHNQRRRDVRRRRRPPPPARLGASVALCWIHEHCPDKFERVCQRNICVFCGANARVKVQEKLKQAALVVVKNGVVRIIARTFIARTFIARPDVRRKQAGFVVVVARTTDKTINDRAGIVVVVARTIRLFHRSCHCCCRCCCCKDSFHRSRSRSSRAAAKNWAPHAYFHADDSICAVLN